MIKNLVGETWEKVDAETVPVYDPARAEVIDEVPLSGAREIESATRVAAETFPAWSRTPIMERVRLMFAFKTSLEAHAEELAALITRHHGKTLSEARGEVRRGIEVVDFACGAPTLLQGRTLRQVSTEVDQDLYRFPLGVVAGITPFNFPVMIPLWMIPLAVVTGNTFVLKPSEQTPLGAVRLAELFLEAGFPPGVLGVVNGGREAVDALVTSPNVRAVSFVGSEPVARHVYELATSRGKRVQALGGAKNHSLVMPDADLETTVPALLESAFGNAGERCLAGSAILAIGSIADELTEALCEGAEALVVGPGDQPTTQVGPLIRDEHRKRVLDHIDRALSQGAAMLRDGRGETEKPGFFLGPTVIGEVTSQMSIANTELFGPVVTVATAQDLDSAIAQANLAPYGNMGVIFTRSGRAARRFREDIQAGMVGVNVPIAQPFGFFPFSGHKSSFYGDLHVQGADGVEFYTTKKMVVSRW